MQRRHTGFAPAAYALAQKNRQRRSKPPHPPRTGSAGPISHCALVLTTLWPQVTVAAPALPALRLLLALATIALTRKLVGGIAVPTLVGIVVFGGLQYWAFHS